MICTQCGTESPGGFRFCGACGAPLAEPAVPAAERKVVTVLFCDLVGSTALGEQLDPEALQRVLHRYFDAAREAITHHGGTVHKYAGDSLLAAFGIPHVREDDALRAIRAAGEIQSLIPSIGDELELPLAVRIGVNTGVVVTDGDRNLVLGDTVNVAARLQQSADSGTTVIGAETLRLVRDAVTVRALAPLALKGKSGTTDAHLVLTIDPDAAGVRRRLEIPMVDRIHELGRLRAAWEGIVRRRRCRLVTIVGAAGVGKSRLAEALLEGLAGEAQILRGRCLSYGEGITFWPLAEALHPLGERAQEVLAHLSHGGAANPEELFLESRRLLESLAAERPLVLYIDDLQWAEPMLVGLLTHLVTLSRRAPLMVLGTARSELLESAGAWPTGVRGAELIELQPLERSYCEQLLDNLEDPRDAAERERVIVASEGNPLFLQEMSLLAHDHHAYELPPTIQALLAARMERLAPAERELLTRCAVEGQVFHRSAVAAMATGDGGRLDVTLEALVRKDLILPHSANVPGDVAYRFRHLLIRDAAYELLTKADRAALHARYADWLEHAPVDFAEVDEIAGWHLEQAAHQVVEVHRRADAALAERAAARLYAAGRRAGERSDLRAARNLLERALQIVPADAAERAAISIELADRLVEVGELGEADMLLTRAEASGAGDAVALSRLEWTLQAEPERAHEVIDAQLPLLLASLRETGDARAMAKAHMLAFWRHWAAARATLAAEQARLAAEHAQRAADAGARSRALGWYVASITWGPQSAAELSQLLDATELEGIGPFAAGFVLLGRGEVARWRGEFDEARERVGTAVAQFRELGMPTMVAGCGQFLAAIALRRGDPEAAVDALRDAEAIFTEFGERSLRSTTQAMLSLAYATQGAVEAARAAVELAESLSSAHDLVNFSITQRVRARLAVSDERADDAERWARSALEIALRTDFLEVQAEARLELARTLAALGQTADAVEAGEHALAAFTAKGDLPGQQAAARVMAELQPEVR